MNETLIQDKAQQFMKGIKKRLFISLFALVIGFVYIIRMTRNHNGNITFLSFFFCAVLAVIILIINFVTAEMDREKLFSILFQDKDAPTAQAVYQQIIAQSSKSFKNSFISSDFYFACGLSMLLNGISYNDTFDYLNENMGQRMNDNSRFKVLFFAYAAEVQHNPEILNLITPLHKMNALNQQSMNYYYAVVAKYNHDEVTLNEKVSDIQEHNIYPLIAELATALIK
ncbi:hypothetical protein G7062_05275 [Erysipelothrix sp. HDW6C]|uniref:hypothetical protein n=1 Tax=Erysipelothrix sp. HDW6C TaxID=2714930 RepID=UPI00140C8387|nr:hypothetical protein [Erysipelothrix sp. HDW6C]QIK69743.1 hypothetical protein G7062_05275 [Erysipelothrix sp. HDW6C]